MHKFSRVAVATLLVVVAAACSGDDDDDAASPTTDAAASADDVVVRADLSAMPGNELGAVLEVETDSPTPVSVSVDGPGGGFEIPATDESRIPIVGMRAESDYTITVTAGAGSQELEWTTGSLPDDLPPVTLEAADAAEMAPGVTLFNAFGWDPVPEGTEPPDAGYILAVDAEGEVVWYQRLTHQILDVDTTTRGTFLVTAGETLIQEIDLFGTVLHEWGGRVATEYAEQDLQGRPLVSDETTPIDVDSTHHEVTELPNGNIITLSTELLELDEADATRLCPDDPEASIVGDIVVELSPDGDVVHEWPISAVYDAAEYPGAEMCIQGLPVAPPNWFYPQAGLTRDWSHANSVVVDEERNELLVSNRHFDGILALRYLDDDDGPAGELLWSLGARGEMDLEGAPPYHQHAIDLADDGSIMLYDNGNFRPGSVMAGGSEANYSRAVLYEMDIEGNAARQVWEHRDTWADGRPVFTPFLGDVDRMPNGSVLITHGGGSAANGAMQGLLTEVVPGDAADGSEDEVVFRFVVGSGEPSSTGAPTGWSVYRAERLPSLYFGS